VDDGGTETGVASADPELDAVVAAFTALDPEGHRFAAALRRSIDMLLDGQHTGRYLWSQLHKTEKTYAGTLVEINLQREFDLADGARMDYQVAGVDVDCKFSQDFGGWMVPPEAEGELLLLVWASDAQSAWSAGVIRAVPEVLTVGGNRDRKRAIRAAGRSAVRWLFERVPLPENTLLHIPADDLLAIWEQGSRQKRVDMLFRRVQHRRISRTVVATVAEQEDYMKRVRYDGGARSNLQPEGIVILGQGRNHRAIAAQLGIPEPQAGESVSARVVRLQERHGEQPSAEIAGERWTLAKPGEPVEPAPRLPKV
jgi:hypothetical protein